MQFAEQKANLPLLPTCPQLQYIQLTSFPGFSFLLHHAYRGAQFSIGQPDINPTMGKPTNFKDRTKPLVRSSLPSVNLTLAAVVNYHRKSKRLI
jgi:hypothetical protein